MLRALAGSTFFPFGRQLHALGQFAKSLSDQLADAPNWLPSPSGSFFLAMRLYWPKSEALDGKWKAPPLVQVAEAKTPSSTGAVPVTPDNFPRAESDLYFGNIVKDGGFGRFTHRREPAAIDKQTIIRLNRDTLYSAAVFDLGAGPVAITLLNPGKRFMSMQVMPSIL